MPLTVWVELLPLIALEVCPGQFVVKGAHLIIESTAVTLTEKGA